jgi:hypothetical protein
VKSRVHLVAGVALVLGSLAAGTAGVAIAKSHNDGDVLRADTLFPVDKPFTGSAANAIRGVTGAGAPWVIGDSDVRLRADGRLKVEFEGLVIAPNGPAAVAGTNPVPVMKITVSCVSTDAAGAATTMNASTEGFPVDAAGNGEIETMVSLPHPCVAPIIFVANNNAAGAWFAVTGV